MAKIEPTKLGQVSGKTIHIAGIVQGVGFRPFVYSLATKLSLTGWVRNTSAGVEIQVDGTPNNLGEFVERLKSDLPPLARIDQFSSEDNPAQAFRTFEILASQSEEGAFIPISPDISICPDCLRECFDPSDRRYRYPFINCTNCGPRFTIIQDIPYDRPKTTMSGFQMCPECQSEYENPLDRRFHAQPVACPKCGPRLSFIAGGKSIAEAEDALSTARQWLRAGKILAVKGLGGFHLACDAFNPDVLQLLRSRKHRSRKPFALMAHDLKAIAQQCSLTLTDENLLLSRQRPIVLLDRLSTSSLPPEIAPLQSTLGIMLPYTPLHYLLLEPDPGFPEFLVMTSANLSEEPIAYKDEDAKTRLDSLADGFLTHNRPIHIRNDDSVCRTIFKIPYFSRRSRGYAPDPVQIPFSFPASLAVGAELKNTFCLARNHYAFLSHYIGDLENIETLSSFEEGISHYENLFRIKPEYIAADQHPDYLSTHYAQSRAAAENIPLFQVQHHHAHLAACLADNAWANDEPAIGLIFDGTGYGMDAAIWGGEFLIGGYTGFERRYHLEYVPLPGGDATVKKPARMALAYLHNAGMDWEPDLPPVRSLCSDERTLLRTQITHNINTPRTSSMGRLFDAVSSLIGVCQAVSYEGEAAIALENQTDPQETGFYPFEIQGDTISAMPLLKQLLEDWYANTPIPIISTRFHNSLVQLGCNICSSIHQQTGITTVVLSGGVWQNRFLLNRMVPQLKQLGFNVLTHRLTPPNDGCISLGQILIANRSLTQN